MDTVPRFGLPLIATALLAALFLVRGVLHPELNYDAIPYAALAKEMRGDGGKAEAYRELAAKVGTGRFQLYVSGPYRERMYQDDGFFQTNKLLYTNRPFYIFLCSVAGSLLHSDIAATYVVSAVAASLAALLSFVLATTAGLAGNWRLGVPLTWIVAGGLNLASLSTPDALETLLSLLFIATAITGPWKGVRAICLLLLATLMVATRPDAVLFVTALISLEWLLTPRHRVVSALVFLGALSTYLVIHKVSGSYGYIFELNFALLEDRAHDVVPNLVPNLPGYILVFIHEVLQILGADFQPALFFLAVSLLAVVWFRERARREADGFSHRALILSAALVAYLIARFALFPLPLARYMMSAYVLAGILFTRAVQPTAATSQSPGPTSKLRI